MTEISKEKAKYLKRNERAAKRNAELSARRRNQRVAQKVQQAAIAEMHKKIDATGPKKFEYTDSDLARIKKNQARMMLPKGLKAQAMLAAAAVTAEPAPEQKVLEAAPTESPAEAPQTPVTVEMASESQT